MISKEERLSKIVSKYQDCLEENQDLYANQDPSFLFYIMANSFSYLMDNNPEVAVKEWEVKIRKPLHIFTKILGPFFLSGKQVFEDRNLLVDKDSTEKDQGITLPKEPVIWVSNHSFRGDSLASLMATKRDAFALVGNVAQFYNSIEGIPAYVNGTVLVNRRNKKSRKAAIKKCKRVIDYGGDVLIYPEGVSNKTPNALSLHLFSGFYKIAKDKNSKIIPIIHYKENSFSNSKQDVIHTVIDDPIDVSKMTQEEALITLKDTFAYWKYLMMERYGQSTREKELNGQDPITHWEEVLENRPIGRYDKKAEITYYPKSEREYFQALEDIASLEETKDNVLLVEDAKKLVKNQFQRRY